MRAGNGSIEAKPRLRQTSREIRPGFIIKFCSDRSKVDVGIYVLDVANEYSCQRSMLYPAPLSKRSKLLPLHKTIDRFHPPPEGPIESQNPDAASGSGCFFGGRAPPIHNHRFRCIIDERLQGALRNLNRLRSSRKDRLRRCS